MGEAHRRHEGVHLKTHWLGRKRDECHYKETAPGRFCDGTSLSLDWTGGYTNIHVIKHQRARQAHGSHVDVQILIVYYGYVRCNHRGKRNEGYKGSLYSFCNFLGACDSSMIKRFFKRQNAQAGFTVLTNLIK